MTGKRAQSLERFREVKSQLAIKGLYKVLDEDKVENKYGLDILGKARMKTCNM